MQIAGYNINIPDNLRAIADEYNTEWGQTGKAKEIKKFLEITKEKKNLIDIGGFYGFVSLLFCVSSNDRHSFCFEPNKNFIAEFFDILNQNKDIESFDNIIMYPFFVGNKNEDIVAVQSQGVGMLNVVEKNMINGDQKIFTDMSGLDYEKEKARGLCKSITLDTFMFHLLTDRGTIPDVVKIDVEGYESNVLEGGDKTLRNFRPYIFIEVHKKHLSSYGSNITKVYEHIDDLNYNIYSIEGKKTSLSEYISFFDKKNENHFYCIPKEED